MSAPMHTPGPWRAKTSRVIVAPRSNTNAHGETLHYEGEVAWTQPVPSREGGEITRIANARLIAAAPELLAELEKAEDFMSGFEGWDLQDGIDEKLAGIRAAIAKAKGGAA